MEDSLFLQTGNNPSPTAMGISCIHLYLDIVPVLPA